MLWGGLPLLEVRGTPPTGGDKAEICRWTPVARGKGAECEKTCILRRDIYLNHISMASHAISEVSQDNSKVKRECVIQTHTHTHIHTHIQTLPSQ